MKRLLPLLLLLWSALPVRSATYSVIVPTRTTLTNGMLPYATSGVRLSSSAVQVVGRTNLVLGSGGLESLWLNTGQGENELWDMNQNVTTASDVMFNSGLFATDSQALTFTSGFETLAPAAAVTLNFDTASEKRITLDQNTTFSFSNIPASAVEGRSIWLEVVGNGAFTVDITGDIPQTALVTVPPASVVTLYEFRGHGGVVDSYGYVSEVSDAAFGSGWNGVTTNAPSKNAVYDWGSALVDDTAFGAGWNGDTTHAPSRNAVYDWGSVLATGGYVLTIATTGSFNPADSTTYYIGGNPIVSVSQATYTNNAIRIPKAGTITQVTVRPKVGGAAGTTESVEHYIRLNDTTDTTINLNSSYSLYNVIEAAATVSVAVVAGDYVALKVVTPAWVTNPSSIAYFATIYIE